MKLIRKQLAPLASFAFPTRYVEATNTVQASFDGGTTWEDFPEGDPRKNDHTPPPDTADPRCDAAARIRAATEEEAAAIIEQVDLSATLIPVVTGFFRLFTPLFTIIPYLGLAYTLLQAILSIGSVALHAAFDEFDWDEFECLLYKNVDAGGQLSDAGFEALLTDIAATYSDATETLLYNFYYLAGRSGLNDQAGIRSETGDCSACPTTWQHDIYPADTQFWNFQADNWLNCAGGTNWGYSSFGYVDGDKWKPEIIAYYTPAGMPAIRLGGYLHVPPECTLVSITMGITQTVGGNLDVIQKRKQGAMDDVVVNQCYTTFYTGYNILTFNRSGAVCQWTFSMAGNGSAIERWEINYIRFAGTGVNPFL